MADYKPRNIMTSATGEATSSHLLPRSFKDEVEDELNLVLPNLVMQGWDEEDIDQCKRLLFPAARLIEHALSHVGKNRKSTSFPDVFGRDKPERRQLDKGRVTKRKQTPTAIEQKVRKTDKACEAAKNFRCYRCDAKRAQKRDIRIHFVAQHNQEYERDGYKQSLVIRLDESRN